MDLYIASGNKGKIKEFQEALQETDFQVKSLHDFDFSYEAPEETGKNFQENALIKANALHDTLKNHGIHNAWILADDSGLCCDALDGEPGLYSAMYAGDQATDTENVEKLLNQLKKSNNSSRQAHFIAHLTLIAGQEVHHFVGRVDGMITKEPRGDLGFGYDPVFQPDGFSETLAEIPTEVRVKISNRGVALKKLFEFLKNKKG
jgi:XTP/dITP diphosphohydrolase